MTDESAKALAEAMNRLAAVLEKATHTSGGLATGIQVYHSHQHHGLPQYHLQQPIYPHQQPFYPSYTWGNATGGNLS